MIGVVALIQAGIFSLLTNLLAKRFVASYSKKNYDPFSPLGITLMVIATTFFYLFLSAAQPTYFLFNTATMYLFFAFALSITLFTDAYTLLISRWTTLYLLPVGWLAANFGILTIGPLASVVGSLLGLLILSLTARLAYYWTKQESLGQGDIDLLAFIGAFLGPAGCWRSLVFGSCIGSGIGVIYLLFYGNKARSFPLPFGTFLVLGAMTELLILYNVLPLPPFFAF